MLIIRLLDCHLGGIQIFLLLDGPDLLDDDVGSGPLPPHQPGELTGNGGPSLWGGLNAELVVVLVGILVLPIGDQHGGVAGFVILV